MLTKILLKLLFLARVSYWLVLSLNFLGNFLDLCLDAFVESQTVLIRVRARSVKFL